METRSAKAAHGEGIPQTSDGSPTSASVQASTRLKSRTRRRLLPQVSPVLTGRAWVSTTVFWWTEAGPIEGHTGGGRSSLILGGIDAGFRTEFPKCTIRSLR